MLALPHQTHRPLPYLWWIPARLCHDSILSRIGVSNFPRANHIAPDHTPHGVEDTEYGPRGKAFATGYMNGLLQRCDKEYV